MSLLLFADGATMCVSRESYSDCSGAGHCVSFVLGLKCNGDVAGNQVERSPAVKEQSPSPEPSNGVVEADDAGCGW